MEKRQSRLAHNQQVPGSSPGLAIRARLSGSRSPHTNRRIVVPQFRKPTVEELDNRFTHHPPVTDEQVKRYETVRATILETAKKCVELTPCSSEQTRALNALDEAMFLFNAAIARHEGVKVEVPSE